jgi:hypothetical protein
MSFYQAIQAGVHGTRRRWPLVVLLYGLNLALALVFSAAIYAALAETVGPTGYGVDLARGFDIVLWADLMETMRPVFFALTAQLFWVVPLWLLWRTALGVGLVHALRGQQIRSFWQGVGRYTGRGLLVALLFVPLMLAVVILLLITIVMLNVVFSGEVGTFWVNGVVAPVAFFFGFAFIGLLHDYARIALVVDERKATKAWKTGVTWPLRHQRAVLLYVAWLVPAAALLLLPTLMDASFVAAAPGSILGLFALQQVALFLRAAVTVGWIGSETAYYEDVQWREAPLIAEAEPAASPLA